MDDGLSGILTQLYDGAKHEGNLGLMKGVEKGFAGVIAKPGAGESVGFEFIGSNRVHRVERIRY